MKELIVADSRDEENGDATTELKETKMTEVESTVHISFRLIIPETNVKTSEPAMKKRRVIMEDSDEDITSTTKKSPHTSLSTTISAPKPAEEAASEEESNSASAEDEPDPKTKMKSAEKLFCLALPSY